MITIGSLFSGIGGLELGIESALSDAGHAARVAWQVEMDPYCRAVLEKHWPDADRSVIDVCRAGASLSRVDVLCGGPPCQDISGAGKQEGLSGESSGLLFEYLRIVRELRPRVCVVENVHSGQWRTWLDAIRCGLIGAGYRVRAGGLRASDVGAPHRRARIFVVAYANGERRSERSDTGAGCSDQEAQRGRLLPAPGSGAALADSHGGGLESQRVRWLLDGERAPLGDDFDRRDGEALGDADGSRRDIGPGTRGNRARIGEPSDAGERIAEPGLGRDAHGISRRVDLPSRWPAGRGEEQHAWEPPRTVEGKQVARRQRLKSLGNAVVPECARIVARALVVPYL